MKCEWCHKPTNHLYKKSKRMICKKCTNTLLGFKILCVGLLIALSYWIVSIWM